MADKYGIRGSLVVASEEWEAAMGKGSEGRWMDGSKR